MTRSAAFLSALTLLAALLTAACTRLPKITPLASGNTTAPFGRCEKVFPQGRWQFVHAIEATLSGGSSVVLGVSRISSTGRRIHSLIMTVEGIVLFEADRGDDLRIRRAVPPFASENFARGLMDDIAFIFFAPRGPAVAGRLQNGAAVCRYRLDDGGVVDVLPAPADGWEVRQYDAQGRLARRLQASDVAVIDGQHIPRPLTLEARPAGGPPYRLKMKLVEALPIRP